jgi:simple sugar transport system substrate-binding protein
VLRNINAFTLGAQSVNPKVTTQVIFTGDWALPVKEAEATNSMIAQGVDVVTCHVDQPEGRGRDGRARRHLHQRLPLQPGQARAQGLPHRRGVELGARLCRHGRGDEGGKPPGNFVRGGLKEGYVRTSAYGPAVSALAREKTDAAKSAILNGSLAIYKGALKDNKGNTVIPAGRPTSSPSPSSRA